MLRREYKKEWKKEERRRRQEEYEKDMRLKLKARDKEKEKKMIDDEWRELNKDSKEERNREGMEATGDMEKKRRNK